MKNVIKKSGRWCLNLCFLLVLLVPVTTGLATTLTVPVTTCPEPEVWRTDKTSSSISFAWNSVLGATAYQIWYIKEGDSSGSAVITKSSPAITITGLPPGAYHFYFATVCAGGTSDYVIADDLIVL